MKVLVVDDEPGVIDFVSQVAQAEGHSDIDAASSGEEALAKVIRADYDLITLDIEMPGASGLEVIAILRDMCPHAIIAVVSGHIPDDLSAEVAGCADVMIAKPVSMQTLTRLMEGAAQVREAIEGIRLLGVRALTARS